MTESKRLGKISQVRWGRGGYQDAMVGLSLTFDMQGSCVSTFLGGWSIKRSEYCKWTEDERLRSIGEAGMKVAQILDVIHRDDVNDILGTPVEVTLDGNMLKDWRLLTEVL